MQVCTVHLKNYILQFYTFSQIVFMIVPLLAQKSDLKCLQSMFACPFACTVLYIFPGTLAFSYRMFKDSKTPKCDLKSK